MTFAMPLRPEAITVPDASDMFGDPLDLFRMDGAFDTQSSGLGIEARLPTPQAL